VSNALVLAATIVMGTAVSAAAGLLGIGDDAFILYDLNPATAVASNPRPVGNKINMIAYAPDGSLGGVPQGTPTDVPPGGMLYTIDPLTGTATYRATLDTFVFTEGDIACDPTTGILYAIEAPGQLFKINTTTGAGTIVGTVGSGLDLSAIAFDAAGNLDMVESFGQTLYKVNKSNAAILESHPMGSTEGVVGGLAYLPSTASMIFAAGVPFCQFYNVNCATGTATLIAPVSGAGFMFALTYPANPTPVGPATWGRIKAMYR
jgi:hypothetical protein